MLVRKILTVVLATLLLPAGMPAQPVAHAAASATRPQVAITKAPPETAAQLAARKLALQEMLQRLSTTGRIMQVVAHPDDEDGAMLTLESRVKGNTAELFTFTRGEGGQNAQGAVFFDELGLLRTLELLAADTEYGAEERFSHLADFGFSKSAQETYQKWGGRDVPLKDLVEAVREFQPDVLVARFSGTPKDGHGHHQASAQLTVQAFTDAADAKRFSSANEHPWQASKLYTGLAGDAATLVADETQPSALLDGKTPQEVAIAGLRHQESQGAGNWKGPIPKLYSSYKLVTTANGIARPEHETDFFQGIDTSLVGLPDRFPAEAERMPGVRVGLARAAREIEDAKVQADTSPQAAVVSLSKAFAALRALATPVCAGVCSPDALESRIQEKRQQAEAALLLAAGVESTLERTDSQQPFASPGDTVSLRLETINRGSQAIELGELFLNQSPGVKSMPATLQSGSQATFDLQYTVPDHVDWTRLPIYRESPVKDAAYKIDKDSPSKADRLPPLPLTAYVPVTIAATKVQLQDFAKVYFAPALSIQQEPTTILARLDQNHRAEIHITVQNNSQHSSIGAARLSLPGNWLANPAQSRVSLDAGASRSLTFDVQWPAQKQPAEARLEGHVTVNAKTYSENYHLLSRADLPDAFPYYAPAQTTVSLINADIPAKHSIGYVMGSGDPIPDALTSLGFDVHLLTADDLSTGDLAKYDTIVTGVRAYGSRADLREHNLRLLEYVKNGGTMVVQYEQDVEGFNKGNYVPYPLTLGRDRVSQEEQPVTILDPASPVLKYPNKITATDFDGWVQERGLYFARLWSSAYTPLLRMDDVGEPPLDGALLVAHYGKGTYITTSLAFYRELPNGVAGAARLFINLLGAGQQP